MDDLEVHYVLDSIMEEWESQPTGPIQIYRQKNGVLEPRAEGLTPD